MAIWDSTTKFNSRQYFRLYGIKMTHPHPTCQSCCCMETNLFCFYSSVKEPPVFIYAYTTGAQPKTCLCTPVLSLVAGINYVICLTSRNSLMVTLRSSLGHPKGKLVLKFSIFLETSASICWQTLMKAVFSSIVTITDFSGGLVSGKRRHSSWSYITIKSGGLKRCM